MTATRVLNLTDDQKRYLEHAQRIAPVAINRKEVLFRFLRFSSDTEKASVRAAIVDRHFRFGRPRDFNDPFDCRPHLRKYHFFGGLRFRRATLKLAREKFPDDPAKQRRARNELANFPQEHLIKLTEERVQKELLDTQLMLCLVGNRSSLIMWAYYADRQRGVCIHLRPDMWPVAAALRVSYGNLYPSVTLPPNYHKLVREFGLRKARAWRHENEYRLLVQDEDAQRFGLEWVNKNTAVFPPGSVIGITVGALIHDTGLQEIVGYAALANPAMPVYRAVAQRGQFKLAFEQIA